MLVRLTTSLSGPRYTLGPGDEYEFPNDEAVRLMEAGFAVPVGEIDLERAVNQPATETRRRRKSK